MILKSYFSLEERVFSSHPDDPQYQTAYLLDIWDRESLHFEKYRLPAVTLKGNVLSLQPQEPSFIVEIGKNYLETLEWIKVKFDFLTNQENSSYVDWEISRVRKIVAEYAAMNV